MTILKILRNNQKFVKMVTKMTVISCLKLTVQQNLQKCMPGHNSQGTSRPRTWLRSKCFGQTEGTRSQAVARIADRTASQQTLVPFALPMKLHAVNSTIFRLLYRSTIRINTALIFAAPSQSLKNITLSPFRKLVRPVVPSDIPGDQYFEYVTANSIFILFLQISLTRVVIKWS